MGTMTGPPDINDHVRAGGAIPSWDEIPPLDDLDAPPELNRGNGTGKPSPGVETCQEPVPEDLRVDRLWPLFAAELAARAAGGCPTALTGLEELDALLGGGLPPGQVTLLCGSPGAGKTSLAMGWAVRHARAGGRAVVWSLELPEVVALARLVSQHTSAPWSKVLSGGCPDDVDTTGEEIAGLPLYLVDKAGDDGIAAVDTLLPAQQAGEVPHLLVVDYAQLLAVGGDQRTAVEKASGWLVEKAKTTGAAVLAISSTSRAAYGIGTGKVEFDKVLSMARDTGRLEFDAAVVLGLIVVREAGTEDVPERFNNGWLVAAKNRLGQRGRVAVELDGQAGTVREISPEEMMPARGGLSDTDLKEEVLRVVAGAEAQGEPLTSKNAINERVKGQKKRVLDAITDLLHPDDGRLTGGNGKPFQVVEKDDEPTTEAKR